MPVTYRMSKQAAFLDVSQPSLLADRESTPDDGSLRPAEFLTVREAAAILRVSYSSVLAAIHAGSLVAYGFGPNGGTYRIRRSDLSDYVAASCTRKNHARSKPRKSTSTFQKLDKQRLLRAWRDQGVTSEVHEEASE